MGKFVISATATGFKFALKAGNGETIATSEIYSTQAACIKGAESVAKVAPEANLADLTVGGEATNPKFELYEDKGGQFRFRLCASNGQNLLTCTQGYTTKPACKKGIASVIANCEGRIEVSKE